MLLHDGPAAACALNRARFDTLFLTHDISGIGVHRQCGDVDASSKDVQNLLTMQASQYGNLLPFQTARRQWAANSPKSLILNFTTQHGP